MTNSTFELCRKKVVRCSVSHCAQGETGDCYAEIFARFFLHEVRAFHGTFEAVENAEAVILVGFSRHDNRLFADDSFALDFFDPTAVVVDEPVPAQELYFSGAVIFDLDKVREDEFMFHHIGFVVKKDGPHVDRDLLGCCGECTRKNFHDLCVLLAIQLLIRIIQNFMERCLREDRASI